MTITEYRGVEGLVYAEVTEDSSENYTTGEVKPLAGIAEISKTTNTSSEVHYYDNIPAVTVEGSGADEVTISTSAIPFEVLSEITGQYYDTTTKTFVEQERTIKHFAIGYITEKTDGTKVLVWRLKGTFGIPGETVQTKDDGASANGQEITYTGVSTIHKFTKTGKPSKSIYCESDTVNKTTFFNTVQTIDTVSEIAV